MNQISVREAGFADILFLWYLRNQKDVYQYFKNPHPVPWEEHVDFILPILLRLSPTLLYTILCDGIPVGQVRNDRKENKTGEISISVLSSFRGKGIASAALKQMLSSFTKDGSIKKLIAEVHKENKASIALFEKVGFKRKKTRGTFHIYLWKPSPPR